MDRKIGTSIELLSKDLPLHFHNYFTYCKNLKFDEKPDYKYLRQLFRDIMQTSYFKFDYVYDWTILQDKNIPINDY